MSLRFWPYEEVEFIVKNAQQGTILVRCPWLESEIEIQPGSPNFLAIQAYATHGPESAMRNPEHARGVSEVMQALESLPLAYQLPRRGGSFGKDEHRISRQMNQESPRTLVSAFSTSTASVFGTSWSWDAEASLALAAVNSTSFDPLTLLSVARRFHYLDCSDNRMKSVYEKLARLDESSRDRACALIVRQNHYVTEKCESALKPAREIAGSAASAVDEFIQAESGHDHLLAGSLRALGASPQDHSPTASTSALMALLQGCASTNFLAFCMALDFFEKPQFRDEDSLAEALTAAGKGEAARALQIHKDINDGGEHEGFSGTLLAQTKPVDAAYAIQALRLAELISTAIARIPYELEEMIPG